MMGTRTGKIVRIVYTAGCIGDVLVRYRIWNECNPENNQTMI